MRDLGPFGAWLVSFKGSKFPDEERLSVTPAPLLLVLRMSTPPAALEGPWAPHSLSSALFRPPLTWPRLAQSTSGEAGLLARTWGQETLCPLMEVACPSPGLPCFSPVALFGLQKPICSYCACSGSKMGGSHCFVKN